MVRARLTKTPATLPPSDQKPPFWPSPGNGPGGAVGVVVMVRNSPVTVRMVVIGVGVHDDVEVLALVDELDDALDGKVVVDIVDEDRLRGLVAVLGGGDDVVCPKSLESALVLTVDEMNPVGSPSVFGALGFQRPDCEEEEGCVSEREREREREKENEEAWGPYGWGLSRDRSRQGRGQRQG